MQIAIALSNDKHLGTARSALIKNLDPIKLEVSKVIAEAVLQLGSSNGIQEETAKEICDFLVEPPEPAMGDFAFGCFKLAKELKKSPAVLAKDLEGLVKTGDNSSVALATASGPYLNLKLNLKVFTNLLFAPIMDGSFFKRDLRKSQNKIMVEYSQPNTHKELHVGHMRNLCLGQSLVLLLKYLGYEVYSATFPGDVGTHVAKCLWYMKFHNTEPVPEENRGEWLGRMYSKGHILLEDQKGTPAEDENRKQLTEILKQLESKSGPFFELWKTTREWSIELMNSVYSWAGIKFDYWYWESDVDSDSVKWIKELYAEGKLIMSEGAVGMDLSDENLGFCLLLKSDGTGLYATKDLELARRKFQDVGIQQNLYVVDMRQALHFKQVFATLKKLGFEQSESCHHLQYNYVELPDGAMSSRKGNIVPLRELIIQMEKTVKTEYLERYRGEWTTQEVDEVAAQVAQGAIRYGMLRMDTNKKIVFDMKEWLKLDGDSGPFIQYSSARIRSLLKKQSWQPERFEGFNLLSAPAERALLQFLLFFQSTVVTSAEAYKPSQLCTYLFQLAKRFNSFYHDCPISTADEPLKTERLALSAMTLEVLKHGLKLIGVSAPEKM